MKAVVMTAYGGNEVIEVRDTPKPVCGPEDVMIRVHAAGINPVDWKVRSGQVKILTGRKFPKVLGNECAGEVVDVGYRMKKFRLGDEVIAYPGVRRLGAFAEYACSSEAATFPKSKDISFEQAACIPIAGLTALQALRDRARISIGMNVLINGASGGVGHFAVQIAKIYGANVTGVSSGANFAFMKALGADTVIDYTKQDFTRGENRYDIIFDAVAKRSFNECRKVLVRHGIYVSTLPSPGVILNQFVTGFFTSRKARTLSVRANEGDLQWMTNQIRSGRIKVVIDNVYPLDQAKEALAYCETGKAKGKIVIIIS